MVHRIHCGEQGWKQAPWGPPPGSSSAGMLEDGCSSYQRLAEAVSPGARVLDLACGDGALIAILREAGHDVTGLDRSSDELAAARRRLGPGLPLHLGEARALPFEDGSFDAVTCHMAFMLMERPAEVVAEVGRVLVPGGLFAGVLGAAGRLAAELAP